MKILTNIYHYIVFVFILLTVSVLAMFYLQPIAQATPEEISGWGWTDNYGWISLNCNNVYAGENFGKFNSHCVDSSWDDIEGNVGVNYSVTIDPINEDPDLTIQGLGWSDNAGWINFDPITNPVWVVGSIPRDTDEDLDWSFAHEVRLIQGDYTINATGEVKTGYILSGWALVARGDDITTNNAWISFRANDNHDNSDECVVYANPNLVNPDNYCVVINEKDYLAGWAWSNSESEVDGLGWITFQQTFSGGPYLQTLHGDIYSGEGVTGSRAPEGAYNATYCIISGGAGDSIGLSSGQSCLIGNTDIAFRDESGEFTTSIVDIDLDGLRTASILKEVTAANNDLNGLLPNIEFDNQVYRIVNNANNGVPITNFIVNTPISFTSSADGDSGAGTIIIEGDLTINANITYNSTTPNNLQEIASIAWIVLGNVNIDTSVTKVAGTFVILGDGTTDSGKLMTGDDQYICESGSCGDGIPNIGETCETCPADIGQCLGSGECGDKIPDVGETCENCRGDAIKGPYPLSFSGMVVAKEIVLERTYFDYLSPAEIFEYDGRVLLNTPPGLANFAGKLPAWSR